MGPTFAQDPKASRSLKTLPCIWKVYMEFRSVEQLSVRCKNKRANNIYGSLVIFSLEDIKLYKLKSQFWKSYPVNEITPVLVSYNWILIQNVSIFYWAIPEVRENIYDNTIFKDYILYIFKDCVVWDANYHFILNVLIYFFHLKDYLFF